MTKEKAQELIQVMKELLKSGTFQLPAIGSTGKIDLKSQLSSRDHFVVYINRKMTINPKKYTLLLRYPEENLLRIDINGPDHISPDGTIVPCPHIHMRTKDTGRWDAYAYDIPAIFGDTEDCATTVKDFLQYCNTQNVCELVILDQKEIL